MESTNKKINVAIIGGGMGGLSLAVGLLKLPHVNVQIYEAAHQFSEIGAGVAFGPNAQRALRLIGPEAENAYLNQATHNGWAEFKDIWFEFRYGMGPKDGQVVASPRNETGQSTVHRAKFLDEFVKLIPEGVAQFGKRLEQLDEPADDTAPIVLHFKDGTTASADCVIGADGIHSAVRRHLLGDGHPALNAVFSGSVAYRGLIPMKTAVEALGERLALNSNIFMGHGGGVMIYPIDFGATMNIVAVNNNLKSWEGPWVVEADYSKIESEFAEWGPDAKKVIKLLDDPATAAWSMWDHPRAPTYIHGRVAMMGDAAHATTPFQGQGAGQAIEDAFVLYSLLGAADTVEKIPFALQAYDKIRRPRSQMVCKTSREAGELVSLRLPGVEDDSAELKANLEWRMDWMWHRDIAGEKIEALGVFEDLLSKQKK